MNKLDNYAQKIQQELYFKVNIVHLWMIQLAFQIKEVYVTSQDQKFGAKLLMIHKVALLRIRLPAISHQLISLIQETTQLKAAAVHSLFNSGSP